MKRLACLLLFLSAPVSADFRLGFETSWRMKGAQPKTNWNLNLLFDRQFGDSPIGLWGFGQVSEGWAQFYGGISVLPNPYCDFGFALGVEQASEPWRVGGYAYCQYKVLHALALAEIGGSGPWWHAEANVSPMHWLDVGVMARDGHGMGGKIRFLFALNKVRMATYLAVLAEFDTWRPMGLVAFQLWPLGG